MALTGNELVNVLPISATGYPSSVAELVTTQAIANLGGGGGSSAFASLTSGTNTTATMVVGTGASLATSGSGTIAATTVVTNANLTGGVTSVGNAATVVTNANLTGAVTSVGNATSLGSFSSANLAAALTDETGTGAAVFANGPTLIAPALGTPASGVATNLTGTASGLTAGAVSGNPNKRSVGSGTGIPGSGTVVATGVIQYIQVPFAGTITGYAVMADKSGSIVVDVWKANAAIPTVANTITASALPTLSSSQYINSTTLTGWTTAVAANDVFAFNVNSASTLNSVSIVLFITTN